MRSLLVLLTGLFAASAVFAAGGINRDGTILTIAASGLQIQLKPLSAEELPELALAAQGVRRITLPVEIMGGLLKELRPSSARKFFRVDRISLAEEAALVQAYRQILPELPVNDRLTLFAMTDAAKKETYLLPSFFKLAAPSERAAVLFHESMIARGTTNYNALVAMESAMEYGLECTQKCADAFDELQVKVLSAFDRATNIRVTMSLLRQAAVADAKAGLLTGILTSTGDLNVYEFLGPQLSRMLAADWDRSRDTEFAQFPVEYREIRLTELMTQWPESRFLKVLMNSDLNLTFTRLYRFHKSTEGTTRSSALNITGLSSILEWSYKELHVKFSMDPVSYAPEVMNYWLQNANGKTWDSTFYSGTEYLYAVQPMDTLQTTKNRKLYARYTKSEREYYYGESGEYRYYIFGFTLM